MIKSLWSLKVMRGSERHLVNKKNSYHLAPEWHGSFECSHLPLWVSGSTECMTNTGEVSKRHYGGNDDSWQQRTHSWWGELTWGNSSDRWWWFCCPTSLDPGPYPRMPWMLVETHFSFISPQGLSCKMAEDTNTTRQDLIESLNKH